VSSRYGTSVFFDGEDNVVNFADVFQEEDLGVKNLVFEGENENNEVKGENEVIKDEE